MIYKRRLTSRIVLEINIEIIEAFKKSINEESSDRAKVIITVAQIEYLLELKLKEFFSKGNSKARKKLFSPNGSFYTFSSKVDVAYCSGWIDSDVYNDIRILKKIRDLFAHSFESLSLDNQKIKEHINHLQLPQREFYDWGKLKIASLKNGIVFYTGDKPNEAEKKLDIPGKLIFTVVTSILYAVLLENLGFKVQLVDGKIIDIKLPKHMKKL